MQHQDEVSPQDTTSSDEVVIGIDIGTTAVKSSITSRSLKILSNSCVPIQHGFGTSVISVHEVLVAVFKALRKLTVFDSARHIAIALCGQVSYMVLS
jgi:sugar (pentulose or hexulose) kinase